MTYGLIALFLLLGVFGWLVFGSRDARHEPTLHRRVNEDIDYTELEQAERDVQEAEDEDSVRDWGPGAGKPRPPHLL